MYLISAYFDDESAAAIKHVMDAVYKATGNDFMIANQVPPHMTIGAFEQKNDEAAKIERFGLSKPNPHRDLVECRP